jgi:hypothetical protein
VLHGHAHRGQPEGRTSADIPVYNVSLPLLERLTPERTFRVIELRPNQEEQIRPAGTGPTGATDLQ